ELISMPEIKHTLACYYVIATAEASANLARFDGIRFGLRADGTNTLQDVYVDSRSRGFGAEVKQRIMLGTYALSSGYYDAYYGKATQVREHIGKQFQSVFSKVDFILSPTSPITAWKIGEKIDDPLQMYLTDIC